MAGTTTPTPVYSDVGLTTAITQPVTADANGVFVEIFLTPGVAYKVDIQTALGVSLTGYPADNQLAIPLGASFTAFTGVAGETLTAGLGVYLSDGSGGKNAGQWYKWDSANAYSSTTAEIGMAPAAIASGASGIIQQTGQIAGLTSLSVGAAYYVGTAGALTATAPSTNPRLVGHADSATTLVLPDSNPKLHLVDIPLSTAEGRLTATTAVPVTTADVSAATSIFYTPYRGNKIALYDGTLFWDLFTFTEITISLVGLTASTPYDVFAYNNSGVVACETLAWTNTTTRATALVFQNGILSKTGALTRRYLGTVFVNASGGQTDDTMAKRSVFNAYNRVNRPLRVLEATDTWTYSTATVRQANGSTANQLDVMVGLAEDAFRAEVLAVCSSSAGAQLNAVGIGEDSTTVMSANGLKTMDSTGAIGGRMVLSASLTTYPAVGRHLFQWLEWADGSGTTTWYGDNGSAIAPQTGITGLWRA